MKASRRVEEQVSKRVEWRARKQSWLTVSGSGGEGLLEGFGRDTETGLGLGLQGRAADWQPANNVGGRLG